MKINYLKVEQPIGTFYITSIKADTLSKIARVERRNKNPEGVQRELSRKRVTEISKYCGDPDATFPTPIIIAVDEDSNIEVHDNYLIIDENESLGEVIDGQHRLEGIKLSNHISKFELPVVLMFNLYPEEKAYVFSIINSKQTRVNMSLIYDLFALSKNRSPYRTCHELARAFNKNESSPYYNRLKMLGKKAEGQELASLSQGTFIKYTLDLITKNPDEDLRTVKNGKKLEGDKRCVLRNYFIDDDDHVILKILLNLFSGVKDAFPEEWSNPNEFIISKSIGFGAIIKAFSNIYAKGINQNKLTREFFKDIFLNFKTHINNQDIRLTSEFFGSNEQAKNKLYKLIIESLNEGNPTANNR